jgi:hypothetical protein
MTRTLAMHNKPNCMDSVPATSLNRVRIFLCQGLPQLLYILSVVDYLKQQEPPASYTDLLVVGDLGFVDSDLLQVTRGLISKLALNSHHWHQILSEDNLQEGLEQISSDVELFMSRSTCPLGDLLLSRYTDSPLFLFGDTKEIEVPSNQHHFNPTTYICVKPFFMSGFSKTSIRVIPIDSFFLTNVIQRCSDLMRAYPEVIELSKTVESQEGRVTLVPLSMFTELLLCKHPSEEVKIYLNLLKRRVVDSDLLLLKEHPRSVHKQATLLQNLINVESKQNSIVLDGLCQIMPAELLSEILPIDNVVGPWSSFDVFNSTTNEFNWYWSDLWGASLLTKLQLFRLQHIIKRSMYFYQKVNSENTFCKEIYPYSYYGKKFPFHFLNRLILKLRYEINKFK